MVKYELFKYFCVHKYFYFIVDIILSNYNMVELSLTIASGVAFLVFLCYYLLAFLVTANHRHSKKMGELSRLGPQPVSIIVVINNDYDYIETRLPILLCQDYQAPYQVVAVCDTPENDRGPEMLKELATRYKNLYVTVIPADHKFGHTNKLALTVGMKAAMYDNVIITSSQAMPVGKNWLGIMAYGFTSDHVLISGYSKVGRAPGFFNKFQRAINIHESLMMLSRAVAGHPYRISRHNGGQSRGVFFSNRGFTEHLRLNVGESDLYVQQIARNVESNVILNPEGVTESIPYDSLSVWYNRRKFFSYPFRYFNPGPRLFVSASYIFTAIFWVATVWLLVLFPPVLGIAAAAMIALRWLTIAAVNHRFARRTGDKPPYGAILLYDLISPAEIMFLSISRNIVSMKNLWI